jgi:tetratricopeptide (TPR) repeat protein
MGDWEAASAFQSKAVKIGEDVGATYVVACGLAARGYEQFMFGDREKGLAGMRRGCGMLESSGLKLGGQAYRAKLGEICARAGHYDEALRCAEAALAQEALGERHGVPIALRAKAIALARMDEAQWPLAKALFEASAQRATKHADVPALAIARHEYALALFEHGELPTAVRESDAATELFRRSGMAWWLAKAEELGARLAAAASAANIAATRASRQRLGS